MTNIHSNSSLNTTSIAAATARKLPALRVTLLGSFLLLVLLSLIALAVFWYTSQLTRNELTARLRSQIADNVKAQLMDALEPPWLALKAASTAASLGYIKPINTPGNSLMLLELVRNTGLADSAYIADSTGRFLMVQRKDKDYVLKYVEQTPQRSTYKLNNEGAIALPALATDTFQAIERPWFRTSMQTKQPNLGPVYAYIDGDLGITASAHFNTTTGVGEPSEGVVGVDIRLERLNTLLHGLIPDKSDRLFLADATGALVAASSGREFTSRIVNGKRESVKAVDSPDERIAMAAKQIALRIGGDSFMPRSTLQFEINRGLADIYVLATPFINPHGAQWMIGVVLSAEEFDGEIRQRAQTAFMVAAIAMAAAAFMAWWLAKRISRPVRALSHAAKAIAEGELQQHVSGGSIKEVHELSQAFNRMSERLGTAFHELQDSNEHLEQRVDQRTHELKLSRDETERLLLNILPERVAQRLKRSDQLIADSFDEVTVLFADVAGFTRLAIDHSPQALVGLLNELFSELDDLAVQIGLEKIKTIGDCYMVACGLPARTHDHAQRVARFALGVKSAAAATGAKWECKLNMRIGINTGPVVAGVIGKRKFTYDMWGDTVNIASRMESSGEPGRIQVSQSSYELLRNEFEFEVRGTVSVKDVGDMQTYWLLGEKR